MSYRREEERAVYPEATGVPVERRAVAEERAVEDPAIHEAAPARNEVVRERVVEQPYVAAAPVRDEVVSDRVVEDESIDRLSTLDLVSRVIWFLTGLLIVGLVFRFIMKATGANTGSSFVR